MTTPQRTNAAIHTPATWGEVEREILINALTPFAQWLRDDGHTHPRGVTLDLDDLVAAANRLLDHIRPELEVIQQQMTQAREEDPSCLQRLTTDAQWAVGEDRAQLTLRLGIEEVEPASTASGWRTRIVYTSQQHLFVLGLRPTVTLQSTGYIVSETIPLPDLSTLALRENMLASETDNSNASPLPPRGRES